MNDLVINNIRLRKNVKSPKGYDVYVPSGINGQKFDEWKLNNQQAIKSWKKTHAIHSQIISTAIKKKKGSRVRKRTKNA